MKRGNLKKVFINSVLILLGFIFGLGISVLAWVNPSQNPPLGGGVLQTDNSGLKIITTTQITTGNFTVNTGNVGIGTTNPNNLLQVVDLINFDNIDFNTFLGYQAGKNVVSGAQYNTFIGYQAGFMSTTSASSTADYNTAIGYQALYSNTGGPSNTAIGPWALYSNTGGDSNTAIGPWALYSNTIGEQNTAIGTEALRSNTTGSYNTAIGSFALSYNTTGFYNTAIGFVALHSNTTGYHNTALGYYAGRYIYDGTTANATSTYSVYLGAETRASFSGATNEIVIGYGAVGAGSNSVVLGNDSITKTILKGNVGIGTTTPATKLAVVGLTSSQTGRSICADTNGNFYYFDGSCRASSIKYKTNIQNLGIGLETLLKLRPVTFEFKKDYGGYDGTIHMGFIAEEVEKVSPLLVDYNNGEVSGVRYDEMNALIVKSIQEQQKEIEDLKKEIEELKKMITR